MIDKEIFFRKKYFDNGIGYIRDVCNIGVIYFFFYDFYIFFKVN